jgi:hypothetical protein
MPPTTAPQAEVPSTAAADPAVRELRDAYDRSPELGEIGVRRIRIGGHELELRFATPGLVPCVMPALEHLAMVEPSGDPELVVHLWDTASGGETPATMPKVDPEDPPGAFYFFEDGSMRGVFQPGMKALSVVDFATDHAWYFVEDPAALPYWELAAPIRQILHWWMGSRGHQQLHSGAVGLRDGGVLLVGNPGSGKSTSALASLDSELYYAGDDYSMVSLTPYPMVYSLYCSGKVHPHNLARVPHVVPALWNSERLATQKGVAFLNEHFSERMIHGFPLRAIVMPKVTGRFETRLVPTSRAAALTALAPSTVFQLHTASAEALKYMASLVREVPAYVLELGAHVSDVPRVLLQLLEELRTPGA